MREEKDDGWDGLPQSAQICYTCRPTARRSRKSKQAREFQLQRIPAERPTHKIHEVTPGSKAIRLEGISH